MNDIKAAVKETKAALKDLAKRLKETCPDVGRTSVMVGKEHQLHYENKNGTRVYFSQKGSTFAAYLEVLADKTPAGELNQSIKELVAKMKAKQQEKDEARLAKEKRILEGLLAIQDACKEAVK